MKTPDNSERSHGLAKLKAALSHPLAGYEEAFPNRYLATIEGDGGLSLGKWEPYLQHHKAFVDVHAATRWIHASMSDDWNAGTVLDTQSGTIVASSGMPMPSGEEGNRVARFVRDSWVGDYKWPALGVHDSENPE
jgi:hypothetical protein